MHQYLPDIEYAFKQWSPYHKPPVANRYKRVRGENHFTYELSDTSVVLQGEGLGDLMILRQFGRAIHEYFIEYPDPGLNDIVITTGAGSPAFNPDKGDINLYWWWSFGQYDDSPADYLQNYLDEVTIEPDIILCLSKKTEKEAQQMGFDTIRFPLGTYSFKPISANRSGLGYAGSLNHKRSEKEDRLLGPFINSDGFEWVTHFRFPEELNLWYNSKLVTFGLHKEGQRQWGLVNNRVFETIASGTPLILESHPTVDSVLGFDFPYQTNSKEDTKEIVEYMRENYADVLDEFDQYSKQVRENHDYTRRVSLLFEELS